MRICCFEKMRVLQTDLPVTSQFVRGAIDKHYELWNERTLRQLFNPANGNSRFSSAACIATGKEFSEHILALNPTQRADGFQSCPMGWWLSIITRAATGLRYRVVEVALKSLDAPEPIPVELKQHVTPLLQTLANYKGEKPCYGAVCATPARGELVVAAPVGFVKAGHVMRRIRIDVFRRRSRGHA